MVEHILHNVLEVDDINIVSASRIPSKPVPGRKRLIVATLGDRNMKGKVLRNAKKLRNKQDFRNVFIGPDMTKKECELDYHLRQELKRRRNNSEKHLVIRK